MAYDPSRWASILLVSGSLLTLSACTRSINDPQESPPAPVATPGSGSTAQRAPTQPSSEPQEEREPAASGSDAKESAATSGSSVLKDLQRKIQPEGTEAAKVAEPAIDKARLSTEVERVVARLVDSLAGGDPEAAAKLLVTEEQLEKSVRQGVRDILAGSLLGTNRALLENLTTQLGKKTLKHNWRPGVIVVRPKQGVYLEPVKALTSGLVEIVTDDDVRIEIDLEQLIYTDGDWRILQISAP